MKSILRTLTFMLLLFCQLLIISVSCVDHEQSRDPDYTGQKGQITDVEGNLYNTIGIGTQIWMVENLRTTILNDNEAISQISDDTIWFRYKFPGYTWYDNDPNTNGKIYGVLYNYYTIETEKICPTGWHVPNKTEWSILAAFLGGDEIAGGKLKDYNTPYWKGTNLCIVNNFGFSALPGGKRLNITGHFYEIGESGYWWTSSPEEGNLAYSRSMSGSTLQLYTYVINKSCGFSIRCIKDQ